MRFPLHVRGLVLRPLLREKLRTLLTLLGIAVGVAVLVAIQLSNQSALRSFQESVDAIAGRANFQIVSDAGPIDEELLLKLQTLWPAGGRFAPVIDADAYLQPNDIPVRVLGVDLFSDLHFRNYRYASILTSTAANGQGFGTRRMLELFRPDSIVVPEVLAKEHGWKLGSLVTLRCGGRPATFVIRGILKAEGPATAFNGSLAVVDIATAQRAFRMQGRLSRIDLQLPEREELIHSVEKQLPPNARLERPSRRNERVGKMLRAFRVNLFALAGVALLVGVFLVYNTVLISILRRRREVGVFKTLGVTPAQIFAAFVAEGAIFGLAGSILGIALGYLLAFATLDLIGRTINSLYVQTAPQTITLTPAVCLTAISIGLFVSLLAAMQPAAEAAALPPTSLIRPGLYQRLRSNLLKKLTIGAIVALVVAAALTTAPPIGGIPVLGYAAVMFVVAGVAMLAPAMLVVLSRALRSLFTRLFAQSGRLASSAVAASLRRTSVATAALAVAISMMVAIAIMVGSFRETVRIWVDQTVTSDLWLRPARGLSNAPQAVFPPEILDALKKIEFVSAFDAFRGRDMLFRDNLITVGSGDFNVAIAHGRLPMVTPRDPAAALRDAMQRGGVLISESLALKYHLHVSDTLQLPTREGQHSFPITGIYRDYSNDRGVAVMNRNLYVRLFGDDRINTVAIYLKPGIRGDDARVALERQLGRRFRVFAFTNRSIRREVMHIFDQTFLITYALLAVALIVAVLGIVNTLSALILERRRELALLRVLGMSQGQIRGMIVLESTIIGITAAILGAITGTILSLILIFVINKQSFGWTIALMFPWRLVFFSLFATFITTVVTGIIPSRLANQLQLSTELKGE